MEPTAKVVEAAAAMLSRLPSAAFALALLFVEAARYMVKSTSVSIQWSLDKNEYTVE